MTEEYDKKKLVSSASVMSGLSSFDPRRDLSKEQNDTLTQFVHSIEKLDLKPEQRRFCDEACLIRFLKARDWDLKKSTKLLHETLEWRESYKPDQIFAADFYVEALSGKMFRRGFDTSRRPVVYMTPARENSKDYTRNLQLLVYTLERAIDSMDKGVEQMVWIIDFKDYSSGVQPPLSVCKETINILSNHYPERLGACFLVDCPFIFNLLWKAISPFINSATREKVHFVKGDDQKLKTFSKYFDMNTMEQRFGGNLAFNCDRAFWNSEVEVDEKRRRRMRSPEELAPFRSSDSLCAAPVDEEVPIVQKE